MNIIIKSQRLFTQFERILKQNERGKRDIFKERSKRIWIFLESFTYYQSKLTPLLEYFNESDDREVTRDQPTW